MNGGKVFVILLSVIGGFILSLYVAAFGLMIFIGVVHADYTSAIPTMGYHGALAITFVAWLCGIPIVTFAAKSK